MVRQNDRLQRVQSYQQTWKEDKDMKFILIATALNMQMSYATEAECIKAADMLKTQKIQSVCIPKGTTNSEEMFTNFFKMIEELSKKKVDH